MHRSTGRLQLVNRALGAALAAMLLAAAMHAGDALPGAVAPCPLVPLEVSLARGLDLDARLAAKRAADRDRGKLDARDRGPLDRADAAIPGGVIALAFGRLSW